jgi:CheY-like chemotaxis protein
MSPSAKKILLVEDHLDSLEVIQLQLRSLGFSNLIATKSAAEALRIAETEKPDLILMDIVLSGMSGLEATRRLKSNPNTAHIPVLAITARAMPRDRDLCLQSGCDGYLPKPASSRQLKKAIEEIFSPRAAR